MQTSHCRVAIKNGSALVNAPGHLTPGSLPPWSPQPELHAITVCLYPVHVTRLEGLPTPWALLRLHLHTGPPSMACPPCLRRHDTSAHHLPNAALPQASLDEVQTQTTVSPTSHGATQHPGRSYSLHGPRATRGHPDAASPSDAPHPPQVRFPGPTARRYSAMRGPSGFRPVSTALLYARATCVKP